MRFSSEITAKPTKEFAEAVAARREKGGEILSFGLGEPDFKTPEYIVEATYQAIKEGFTHYSDAQGIKELRELIAKAASEQYGVEFSLNEVAVTPGIKSAAYSALAAILEPGDKVGLCTPCYVAYPAMIKLAEPDAEIVTIDLKKNYNFDMERLETVVKSGIKCLIVNSPNNPTGAMLTKTEIEKIIELCLENHVYILSDEVYDKIVFEGNIHVSFAEYKKIKNYLIIANGFSKSHAMTGWRLGYALAPEDICYKIARLQFNTNTNVATFIQKGACSIYSHEWNHIVDYTNELEGRMKYFHQCVNEIERLSGIMPQGGFFYWLNIEKTGLTSNEFSARLVTETGIATTPGIAFGENWDHYIRFSLAVPLEQIEKAVELLRIFMSDNLMRE